MFYSKQDYVHSVVLCFHFSKTAGEEGLSLRCYPGLSAVLEPSETLSSTLSVLVTLHYPHYLVTHAIIFVVSIAPTAL